MANVNEINMSLHAPMRGMRWPKKWRGGSLSAIHHQLVASAQGS
ncbi:hypothetical protein ACLK15_21715 [Escherichia coli]